MIGQSDITLEHSGHDQEIPMEFESNEEPSMTMETESEEIIGNIYYTHTILYKLTSACFI